ncbi:MAG TPA: polyprenyl diphosphate synthase [bacterium]|nr:polyprenyl diphosphate synthase [bacterium]
MLKHLAIIMDGNRRWAKDQGLPSFAGHQKGYEKLKEVMRWCQKKGVDTLTVYAFSTENWNRSEDEVNFLMTLFHKALTEELDEFHQEGIRLKVIGTRQRLAPKIVQAIADAEEKTKDNQKGNLNLCINYGGRLEIIEAVKKIVDSGVKPEDITDKLIADNLWMAGQADPDLIIRTSGEQRLSGFLTWESVYSEFLFLEKHWPDFSEADFDQAIEDFNNRHRRFGGN